MPQMRTVTTKPVRRNACMVPSQIRTRGVDQPADSSHPRDEARTYAAADVVKADGGPERLLCQAARPEPANEARQRSDRPSPSNRMVVGEAERSGSFGTLQNPRAHGARGVEALMLVRRPLENLTQNVKESRPSESRTFAAAAPDPPAHRSGLRRDSGIGSGRWSAMGRRCCVSAARTDRAAAARTAPGTATLR